MDRDEPPPMTNDVKKDIFGDEEDDDDLFKSAIADKVDKIDDLVGGSELTGNLLSPVELGDENSNKVDKNDLLGQVSSDTTENLLGVDLIGSDSSPNSNRDEDSSGYMTSEVNRSNTLDDIGDNELFKSSLEPSADTERMNGASFSSVPAHLEPTSSLPEMVKPEMAAQAPEPVIFHEEKEISLDDNDDDFLPETETPAALAPSQPVIFHEEKEISLDDDDDEPQYEEEKLQDAHLQPELQLSGAGQDSSNIANLPNISPFAPSSSAVVLDDQPKMSSAMMIDEDEAKELESGDDFIHVMVTDPHKVGDGMSSFIAYNVVTRTNSNYFKKKELKVTRRFSDFLGLHDKLAEKYRQNGRIIPPAPDKSVVGMTKVKISKDGDEHQDEFVERRRAALERFVNRTAAHPTLRTDPDFREFLEQEADLPKSNQTSTLSSRNVMKLINKVGDSLSSMTIKMEEADDWFEEKSQTFEQLDLQLRKLHASTEALSEFRKSLAQSTGSLSKSLAVLSGSEENSALSSAIAQLSTVQEKLEEVHYEQATADFYYLSELIKDYIGLVGAVKDVFAERVKAWQAFQALSMNLNKKREAKVKAELAQRMDKISILRQEIADLERQQEMAKDNFDRISRQIKKEVEMFDVRKANDFKRSIVKYLEYMLKAQEKMTAQWERYLPEVQQISI